MSQRDRDFPLKFDMFLTIEIFDKILHLQQILALIHTAYTHFIIKFVIKQTNFANFLSLSYFFTIDAMCITLKKMKMWQNIKESIPKHVP